MLAFFTACCHYLDVIPFLRTCRGAKVILDVCTVSVIPVSTGVHLHTGTGSRLAWCKFLVAQRISIKPPPAAFLFTVVQTNPCITVMELTRTIIVCIKFFKTLLAFRLTYIWLIDLFSLSVHVTTFTYKQEKTNIKCFRFITMWKRRSYLNHNGCADTTSSPYLVVHVKRRTSKAKQQSKLTINDNICTTFHPLVLWLSPFMLRSDRMLRSTVENTLLYSGNMRLSLRLVNTIVVHSGSRHSSFRSCASGVFFINNSNHCYHN